MLVLEIISIASFCSSIIGIGVKINTARKHNRFTANLARIYELNSEERGKFNELKVPHIQPVEGHTHGVSAAHRTSASLAMSTYAYTIGREPFYVQMSAADQRAGRQGNRDMYWAKDFNAELRVAEPPEEAALCLVDVDGHLDDLSGFLTDQFKPTLLYTFQPGTASGIRGDYKFTFNAKQEVLYEVQGGGDYTHKVWDYSPDCLVVKKTFFWIPYRKAYYTVEKRSIDLDHQLILLTPLAKFGFFGSLTSRHISGTDLRRMSPVNSGFIRLDVSTSKNSTTKYDTHERSTAAVGDHNCATIPVELDNALATMARLSESALTPAHVKTVVPKITHEAAVALVDFHRLKIRKDIPRVIIPGDAVNNYTFNPTLFQDTKHTVAPFMSPIVSGAYAPTNCKSNDREMITERIENFTETVASAASLTSTQLAYANEFAALVHKVVGDLAPVDLDEVSLRQNRPSQQRIIRETAWYGRFVNRIVKSFMKKESYSGVKAPRPIATINGVDKIDYSMFTYAVADAMKKLDWYAFGKSPVAIADRVAEVCRKAKNVLLTDLSKFDGHVGKGMRTFEEILMKALFPAKYHKRMLALMKTQYGKKGVTMNGIMYQNEFGRLSGSPETSILNTFQNAFMAYATLRDSGLEAEEAWTKLGIYGGDDGVTADVGKENSERIAKSLGHDLTAELIQRGGKGVSFLARIYSPAVWEGGLDSCADINRALAKFHTTVAVNIEPTKKLFEKCFCFYASDMNTPILGPFVSRAMELKGEYEFKNELGRWVPHADLPPTAQYPNGNQMGWMQELVMDQGLEGFRQHDFHKWLLTCSNLQDMLEIPSFFDKPPVEVPKGKTVQINDDIYTGEEKINIEEKYDGTAPTTTPVGPTRPPMKAGKKDNKGEDAPFIKPSSKRPIPIAPAHKPPVQTNDTTTSMLPKKNSKAGRHKNQRNSHPPQWRKISQQ